MAGWSGGRKVVAPGVAGHATIRTFHSARFMEDPLAVQCNLVGNPLHEEQLEIVRRLGEIYALNTVIDEDRDLVHVTFRRDHRKPSGRRGVHRRRRPRSRSAARFKTVVTSSAGYPLDKTYYQTVKGMVTPLDILEPGGTLIIASQCSEGFGSPEFREAQARLVELGPERFLATLTAKSLAEIDEWQTEMQLKPMRVGRIQLYTDRPGRRGAAHHRRRDHRHRSTPRSPRARAARRRCGRGHPRGPLRRAGPSNRLRQCRTFTSMRSVASPGTCSSPPCSMPSRICGRACWRTPGPSYRRATRVGQGNPSGILRGLGFGLAGEPPGHGDNDHHGAGGFPT